jgi:short subunit dehydrogenase-like uncharacterized protein
MAKEKNKWVLYGSYGYTGSLIAEIASRSEHPVILSGRDEDQLKCQAAELKMEYKKADLENPAEMEELLRDALLVIHCAGPFMFTWKNMAEACLQNNCHYMDITGEIDVFEGLKEMDYLFQETRLMALPGAGFDVVPSDCLALHLKEKLPDADTLELAFAGLGGGVSKGTATSMAERAGNGGAVRRNGEIMRVPTAYLTREIDFGEKKMSVMSIPWGDISTAYSSTHIENITVFTAMKASAIRLMKLSNFINPVLRTSFVRKLIKKQIRKKISGPTPEQRENGKSLFWARVSNEGGDTVEARMTTPEGYKLTALTTWLIAQKVAAGDFKPGYQTPATAYGKNLILEIDGVVLNEN